MLLFAGEFEFCVQTAVKGVLLGMTRLVESIPGHFGVGLQLIGWAVVDDRFFLSRAFQENQTGLC